MQKRTTIKDLAAAMRVNVSTISRALKDHPDISREVREAVRKLAAEMNYVPNYTAINLRKQNSKVIGLIIPEISMFFFPSVIQGIEDVAHAHGYNLLVLQSNEMLLREIENINICFQNGVAGLLLSVSRDTDGTQHLRALQDMALPIVLFDKVVEDDTLHQVIIDDAAAAQLATEHLLQIGCKSIIGVFGNANMSITKRRIAGFEAAFAKYNTEMRLDAIQFAQSTDETFRIISTLCSHTPPDGVFVMSDEILAGTMPALKRSGLQVPKDCAIVAISDGYLPNYLDPPVTFVRHSGYSIGQQAAELLCKLIVQTEPQPPFNIIVETQIQVQASSMNRNFMAQ
jgi:LacI family transcriptional regulator